MGCSVFRKKQNVVLFDGGLRIESPGLVLYKNRWKKRYVVCQRRNGSEAPLIGLFKNDKAREKGQHLELFYMQNYIGYEYGFRIGATTKTLALLMQDRTLVLSFYNGECMIFWKEWLRDICGRSLIFCMRVNNLPRTAILQLVGNDVRIHLTKTLLVIVQNSPPTQLVCLNLRNLSKVECSDGELSFDANARSWLKLHSFSFTGEHTAQISRALRLLLRPEQFLNPIPNPSDSIHTNNSVLHHPHGLRERHYSQQQNEFVSMPHLHIMRQRSQMTTPAQTLPLPPRRPWHEPHPNAMTTHHYVNTKNTQSLTSLIQQTSMASAFTMPSEIEAFVDERNYHNLQILSSSPNGGAESSTTPIPPPLLPSRKPTIQTTEFGDNTSSGSEGSSPKLDELTHQSDLSEHMHHHIHEEQSSSVNGNTFVNPPQTSNMPKGDILSGLVKIEPISKISLFDKHNVGLNFSRKLFDKLSGSFEQYDGDRLARGYDDENSESFGGALDTMPIIDSTRLTSSLDETHFNTSNISSSTRIDYAVQKQREHLKQRDRYISRMYATAKPTNIGSSGDSSSSSAYQAFPSPAFIRTVAYSENSNGSMNTLQNTNGQTDDQTSCKTTIYQHKPVKTNSNATLQAPLQSIETDAKFADDLTPHRGLSTVSLPVNFNAQQSNNEIYQRIDSYTGSIASIQSEMNEHIVRGGRSRSSGRSISKQPNSKKQTPSSLNYVAIDSNMQWLDDYRQ